MAARDADIRLLFGVSMKGDASGDSAELIRTDLKILFQALM